MLENIQSVAVQVLILFILIGVGFFCQKIKMLDDAAVKGMSNLVLNIITPANIIVAFLRPFHANLLKGLGISILAAATVYGAATIISKFAIREKDASKQVVIRFAASYPNAGYMGIPLQKAILGDIGVFYCAAYIAVFHLYVWTYGVKLLSPKKEKFDIKKILFCPSIIAIFIGMIMFVTGFELPQVIDSPLRSLSTLATPVPMIIIGYYLGKSTPKEIFGNSFVYLGAFIKLIISPSIALLLCYVFKLEYTLAVSCMIASSASSGSMTTMLAAKFGRNTEVSVGMVSFTTLAAIITMPVFIALAQLISR